MKKLSITMPSIHPFALKRALNNLLDTTRCDLEIVVVSPFSPPVKSSKIKWIKEVERRGCAAGHYEAFINSTGEFIFPFADDHIVIDGWDVLALKNFHERESLIKGHFSLGLRHCTPTHVGTVFGIYYPYFPLMRRESVIQLGGWIKPVFKGGFGDSDLALRVWASGGRCEFSELLYLLPLPAPDPGMNFTHYANDDMGLFIDTWRPKYGVGWDVKSLRKFNLDIVPEQYPNIADLPNRTIYFNNPKFVGML